MLCTCVEHGLVEEAVAHPLADDDVDLLHRDRDLLDLAADDRHAVPQTVTVHNLLGLKPTIQDLSYFASSQSLVADFLSEL